MAKLKRDKRISTSEIDKILKRYGVAGDQDALQRSHRLALAQRLMAGLKDADGKREVVALRKNGRTEYIAIDFCDDEKELKIIRHRIFQPKVGIENTVGKITTRLAKLRQFFSH